MLTVEKQGNAECMLATIAAIAQRPLAEVRATACRHAGVRKWARARGHKFWDAVDYTARSIGGEALASLVAPGSYAVNSRVSGHAVGYSFAPETNSLPPVGRGIVRFSDRRGKRRPGHICPWENGLLYDPAGDPTVGITLADYLRKYPVALLKGIRSIAFDGSPEDNPQPTPDLGY